MAYLLNIILYAFVISLSIGMVICTAWAIAVAIQGLFHLIYHAIDKIVEGDKL